MKHVAANLPGQLRSGLTNLLVKSGGKIDPVSISNLLSKVIISYDDSLTKDLCSLFPGGIEELSKLSDSQVKAVIHDSAIGGLNHAKVTRCMQGSTVLVSLTDPNCDNIWVASLGDCQAGVSNVSILLMQEPVLNETECWESVPIPVRVGISPSSARITTPLYRRKSRHSNLHIQGNPRLF